MNKAKTELAGNIFVAIMANGNGLGQISIEERTKLFAEAAQICFEAAEQFLIIADEQENSMFSV